MEDVKFEFLKQEAEDAAAGTAPLHEMSPSVFLTTGLQLEEARYVAIRYLNVRPANMFDHRRGLRMKMAREKACNTAAKSVDLLNQSNVLNTRIRRWRRMQFVYMPGLGEPPGADADEADALSDLLTVDLPSSLPATARAHACSASLAATELKLRLAQAEDSLRELRRQLRIRAGLHKYKLEFVVGPGQKQQTKMHSMMESFKDKADRCVSRYRAAHRALCALDEGGAWSNRLLRLRDEDVKGPCAEDTEDISRPRRKKLNGKVQREGPHGQPSWSHHQMTWIWQMRPLAKQGDDNDAETDDTHEGTCILSVGRTR